MLKLFTKKEVDSSKRQQDAFQASQEKSLIERISNLQKTFNKELQSVSEYRTQMNTALEEELGSKNSELEIIQNEILGRKRELELLRRPLVEEQKKVISDREELEKDKLEFVNLRREIIGKEQEYDSGLEEIAKVKDKLDEREIGLNQKSQILSKQSDLVSHELAKLENLKSNFEIEVEKAKTDLENKSNSLEQQRKENLIYHSELTAKEFQIKNKERSLLDREQRINYYESKSGTRDSQK